jgi:hypothetical protein
MVSDKSLVYSDKAFLWVPELNTLLWYKDNRNLNWNLIYDNKTDMKQ